MESVFVTRIEISLVRKADFGQDRLDRDFGGFDEQVGFQQPLFVQQFRERLAAALLDHVAQVVFVEVQPFGCRVQGQGREFGIDQLEDLVKGVFFAERFAVLVRQRTCQFVKQDRQITADDLSGKDLREEIFIGHIVDDLLDVFVLFIAEQDEVGCIRVQWVIRQQNFVEDAVVVVHVHQPVDRDAFVVEEDVQKQIVLAERFDGMRAAGVHQQDVAFLQQVRDAVDDLAAFALHDVVEFEELVRVLRVGGVAVVFADVDVLVFEKQMFLDFWRPGRLPLQFRQIGHKFMPLFLFLFDDRFLR